MIISNEYTILIYFQIPNLQFFDGKNSKEELANYCKQRNFDPPKYRSILSKYHKFEGIVEVEGMKYTTQPFDYAQELDAEIAAAKVAMENVKDFQVTQESSDVIAQQIFDCISDNGVFVKYLPNIFE